MTEKPAGAPGRNPEPEPEPAGAAFWRAALAFYRRPGARAALLGLQDDHGGDVMQALWALAAAAAGRRIGAIDLAAFAAATAPARRQAAALRHTRRGLKSGPPEDYAAAQAAELAAERRVAALAPDPRRAGSAATDIPQQALARENLVCLATTLTPPPGARQIEFLAGLLATALR